MERKKVELLAPAGNRESLYGAICAGADAVYLGGQKFGARAYADNFTEEELTECIRYAHLWGKKVYLTVNTLVKEREWEELYTCVSPFYEAGADGVIVQDLGVLLFLREKFPLLELHASTQMNITGQYGASYLKELGVRRIVLARELSLQEIREIKEQTGLEIETFIHGAMCYSYSGQCLFSSMLGGRSGNRGRCAQPCRLPYAVTAPEGRSRECYPLSMKDLCTIEYLPELIEAGIDSFKIEGRMKSAEYVAGVTAVYRKYLDQYDSDFREKPTIRQKDMEVLTGLYIRSGIQNGYYEKRSGAEMITLDRPAYNGSDETLLREIRHRYLEQKPLMEMDMFAVFRQGKAAELTLVCRGIAVTVQGDMVQAARKQPVSRENISRQLTRLGDTSFRVRELRIDLEGDVFYPLGALNELRRKGVRALEDEIILSQGFSVRRSPEKDRKPALSVKIPPVPQRESGRGSMSQTDFPLTLSIASADQLSALAKWQEKEKDLRFRRIYLDSAIWEEKTNGEIRPLLRLLAGKTELFMAFPYIIRGKDEAFLRQLLPILEEDLLAGCMVRSLEGYAYLEAHHFSGKIAADAGFYIWNHQTRSYWQDKLDSFCLPLELTGRESRALTAPEQTEAVISAVPKQAGAGMWAAPEQTGSELSAAAAGKPEKVIYGYLPLMITANCVVQTAFGCRHGKSVSWAALTDRYRKQFPVAIHCGRCMNVIYNSVPLSLHGSCREWRELVYPRLNFTRETGQEVVQVVRYFQQLLRDPDGSGPLPFSDYTTGHEKRGVE